MRTMMRSLVVSFLVIVVILLSNPPVHAQDLSKYRNFSFGMTVADVAKQIDQKPSNAAVLHEHPALIEELTGCRRNLMALRARRSRLIRFSSLSTTGHSTECW